MSPAFRILLYAGFVAALLASRSLGFLGGVFVVLLPLLAFVPFRRLKAGWLPISLFALFTFSANVINHPGRIFSSMGAFYLTYEGIEAAVIRTLRFLAMIAGVKLLLATTGMEELLDGLRRIFRPFERFGLPVSDFFHTMGLTLKCFPLLKDMVMARYREDMEKGESQRILGRAKTVAAFLLPLFVMTVRSPEMFFERETRTDAAD